MSLLKTNPQLQCNPPLHQWHNLVAPASGNLFGDALESIQRHSKEQLGLQTDRPIIVVGHQPTIFHTGILAKFIAGDLIARKVGGILVHLVVDHHIGDVCAIEVPFIENGVLHVVKKQIANIDSTISLNDQGRLTPTGEVEFLNDALKHATGGNASMQIANTMNTIMAPYAKVDACIASTNLLQSEIGKKLLQAMESNPASCIQNYNDAVKQFPNSGISELQENELPIWTGSRNEPASNRDKDLRPRALLLTLLARIGIADLFIHGTGGFQYDKVMEQFANKWIQLTPCNASMVTTTIRIPFDVCSADTLRQQFFKPEDQESKMKLVHAIQDAPSDSVERKEKFEALQRWLQSQNKKHDSQILQQHDEIASRRDWAFPLYPEMMLIDLKSTIEEQLSTKVGVVPK